MMDMIRDDLAALDIRHDVFFSERSLLDAAGVDAVRAVIEDLRARDLVYEGRLPPPKGQSPEDWEDREQTLFRRHRLRRRRRPPAAEVRRRLHLLRSDIAYHTSKFDARLRRHDRRVGRRPRRLREAHAGGGEGACRAGSAALDVKLCQLVKLMRNGEPVKMSKRAGRRS